MKRAVMAVGRFLTDWRNGATLLASILVALLVAGYVDNTLSRREATEALKAQTASALDARASATRRIDLLQAQIRAQADEIKQNREILGQQAAALEALQHQVEQMGGSPVVTGSGRQPAALTPAVAAAPERSRTGPATPAREPTPSLRPRPAPSPSERPSPRPTQRPTPSPTCAVVLPLVGCVG